MYLRRGAVTYAYDDNGNQMSTTTPAGVTTGNYDARGRTTAKSDDTFAYNQSGQPVQRTNMPTNGVTRYTYDALGAQTLSFHAAEKRALCTLVHCERQRFFESSETIAAANGSYQGRRCQASPAGTGRLLPVISPDRQVIICGTGDQSSRHPQLAQLLRKLVLSRAAAVAVCNSPPQPTRSHPLERVSHQILLELDCCSWHEQQQCQPICRATLACTDRGLPK